jgi:hypothetical protein
VIAIANASRLALIQDPATATIGLCLLNACISAIDSVNSGFPSAAESMRSRRGGKHAGTGRLAERRRHPQPTATPRHKPAVGTVTDALAITWPTQSTSSLEPAAHSVQNTW